MEQNGEILQMLLLKDENGAAITSTLKAIGDQTYLSVNRKNCL